MRRKPSHVLVVDDDPGRQHEVASLLSRRDYSVIGAATVDDAYARLAHPIDLIIAASRVGSMNGLQFLVSCRSRRPEAAGIILASQLEDVSEMDAWRHGITAIIRPLLPDHFLMVVAEKLAAIRQRQRWPRKKVTTYVPLEVGRAQARLMDVSYGGMRFQLDGESYGLKSPICIDIPMSRLRVEGELVWSARAVDGASCLCGVMLFDEHDPAYAWRAFVDRVS